MDKSSHKVYKEDAEETFRALKKEALDYANHICKYGPCTDMWFEDLLREAMQDVVDMRQLLKEKP